MSKKTPAEAYANWKAKMSSQSVIKSMVDGVQNTQKNPMELATSDAHAFEWRDKMQSNETFNKWKVNTSSFSVADWKTRTAAADSAKMAAAANGAQTKFEAVFTDLMAFEYALNQFLDQALPRGDIQTNVQRSVAFMYGMTAFLKNGKATVADAVAAINAKSGGMVTLQA